MTDNKISNNNDLLLENEMNIANEENEINILNEENTNLIRNRINININQNNTLLIKDFLKELSQPYIEEFYSKFFAIFKNIIITFS